MCFTAFWQVMLVAGNTGDRPALGRDQMLSQMAANNAGNTGDQRVAIHQFSPFVDCVTLIGGIEMSAVIGC